MRRFLPTEESPASSFLCSGGRPPSYMRSTCLPLLAQEWLPIASSKLWCLTPDVFKTLERAEVSGGVLRGNFSPDEDDLRAVEQLIETRAA